MRAERYRPVYETSLVDPSEFWRAAAESIEWTVPPRTVLGGARDLAGARWFPDGELNVCANAVDRHVRAGRGSRVALHYDSAMTGIRRSYSYAELLSEVARFAGALAELGVRRGDRVVIYLPMIPEALVAMLACARLGAVHSVVFGGFSAHELAARIDDAEPVLVLTASGGLELGHHPDAAADETRSDASPAHGGAQPGSAAHAVAPVAYPPIVEQALRLARRGARSVRAVVVKTRDDVPEPATPDRADWYGWARYGSATRPWLDWEDVSAGAAPADPVPVRATDPLYILYTSGTTGRPKGVVRDTGGYAVALVWSMRHIYNVDPANCPQPVIWTTSDIGWVMGHSYIVYGPLLAGATTVMFEGAPVDTPDAGAYWRLLERYRVAVLYTSPSALRAIRKADPAGELLAGRDLSALRTVFSAGESLDPSTYHWTLELLRRPVVDHWWQTETGWPAFANPLGLQTLPVKPGSAGVPVPGFRPRVLDGGGNRLPVGVEGNLVLGLPLPPGTLTGLWRDPQRYRSEYLAAFPGHYATGDTGYFDDDGYLFVLGRSDDVINVAGHRMSTGTMEAVLAAHPAVADCAVIGVHDELTGQRPSGYVVCKAGVDVDEHRLAAELVAAVRDRIGAIAALRTVTVVAALPRTRSGMILRKTMRQIVSGEPYTVPPTIEDPAVLESFARAVRTGS